MKHTRIASRASAVAIVMLIPFSLPAQEDSGDVIEELVVVGSQIQGADTTGSLPVTVMGADDIDAIGVSSTEDLLRSLPQAGEIDFNSDETGTSSNNVRGDIASLNLRGLGADATLSLLNGRRMVIHPGSQTTNGVPTHFVNLNTVPSMGVKRIEVLRDGAAAVYGSDAVAGVVNTVLDTDYEGFEVGVRYGSSQGASLDETTLRLRGGLDLNGGSTNVTFFASFYDRSGLRCEDRDYCTVADKRVFLPDEFSGDTSARNNSGLTPFGIFRAGSADGSFGPDSTGFTRIQVTQNGSSITDSGGRFHFEPTGFSNGVPSLNPGLDLDSGGIPGDLRFNFHAPGFKLISPDTERSNFFGTLTHLFDNGLEFFGELAYYDAESNTRFAPHVVSGSNNFIVPASSYYNPFGAVGNPNRLPGLDLATVPAEGLDMDIDSLRILAAGPRTATIDNDSIRILGGVRGSIGDWDWESAIYQSSAESKDVSRQGSRSLFYQAVSRTDPSAFNPFDGVGGTTSQNGDEFVVDVFRTVETELKAVDLKFSSPALFALPAGEVGAAFGAEFRREEWSDDRDPRLDGTITFTNPLTGEFFDSDLLGISATPDSRGDRDVFSAFAEFLVPILSDVPGVQSLEAQLAVRYEDYDDVGDITRPKIALSWAVNDWLKFRGAYSEGFRAPNLETINQSRVSRFSNSQEDFLRCQVTGDDLACSGPIITQTLGNSALQPEESENTSFGVVLQPLEWLTLTADYWKIEQEGLVGVFGRDSTLVEDIVLRSQGSASAAVVRFAPTAADVAAADAFNLATGRSIAPVGELRFVEQTFENLAPRTTEGIDVGAVFDFPDSPIGDLSFNLNFAYLDKFEQESSPRTTALLAAIADPQFQADFGIDVSDTDSDLVGSLIKADRNPRLRASLRGTWRNAGWGAGLSGRYVSEVFDLDVTSSVDGSPYTVEEFISFSGYGQYDFDEGGTDSGWLSGTRIRLGINNIFDRDPSLFPDPSVGYSSALHSNRGRYFYVDLSKYF